MRMRTFWQRQAPGGAVLCGIPAAGAGGGVPMQSTWLPNFPGLGQSLLISVLLAGVVAAGIWMFKRWGGATPGPARADHAGTPAKASTPDLWDEFDRELTPTGGGAAVSPDTDERELTAV